MGDTKNIVGQFWDYVKSQDSKTAKRIYNWLDRDKLSSITVYNNAYWLELTSRYDTIPNYIYDYIERWCNSKGLVYLYDIKQ